MANRKVRRYLRASAHGVRLTSLSFAGLVSHALPIRMPAANTSAPPTTTWSAARQNGVSM